MEQLKHHQDLTKFQHYHHYNVITLLQVGPYVIIVVAMLKFRQILLVLKLFHPANLENDIFKQERVFT